MEKKRKAPVLRFKDTNGKDYPAWEQRKLEDICDVRDGTHSSPKYFDNGFPLVTSKNLRDGVIDLSDVQLISKEDYLEINKRSKVDLNDILMSMIGTIGNLALIKEEPTFAIKNVALIKSTDKVKMDYLFSYLSSPSSKCDIDKSVEGGTQKFLSLTKVRGLKILLPGIEEQQKIGSFSVLLDGVITLHQRKLEALKKLKRTLLQKMFPKKGHLKPELRFFGFTNDWEQRKLGELAATFGYGLNAAAKSFDGRHKYIRITDIDESTRRFLCSSLTSPDIDFEEAAPYRLAEGDVLFARTGASVGKSYRYVRTDGEVYFAGFLIRFRFKDKEAAEFVFQNSLTAKFQNFIKTSSQRSGQPGINAQQFSGYQIAVPNSEERERIGSFFSRLDTAITLHQRKLEIYKKLKKGLLQKMFI